MPNTFPRIIVREGISYIYDQTRGKILSTARPLLRCGRRFDTVTNTYLRVEDGQPAMAVGDALIRPATITGLTLNCEFNATWAFEVYKRGSPTLLASLSVIAGKEAHSAAIDADVAAGDVLLFKANGVNIPSPRAIVEIAWRVI